MTSFRQFMRQRRNDPPTQFGGDFIGDALADDEFPTVKKWDDLYDYMTGVKFHACAEAIEGALDVWHAYLLFLIRNGEYKSESEKAFSRGLRKRRGGAAVLAAEAGPAWEGPIDDKPAPRPTVLPNIVDEFDGGENDDGQYRRANGERIGSERGEGQS
jgi:hypothetical protein